MDEPILLYKGKPVTECSKEDLLKVLDSCRQEIEMRKRWAEEEEKMNRAFHACCR